jgi:hypothetical protein
MWGHSLIICFFYSVRSTAELESFHNHILMYASKRFSFSPPVYKARTLLAALDYNHHVHRPVKRKADGSIEYVFNNFHIYLFQIYNILSCMTDVDTLRHYFILCQVLQALQ